MDKTTPPRNTDTRVTHAANRPQISSTEILQGQASVEIEHAGQRYLLRVTRENKLILTK